MRGRVEKSGEVAVWVEAAGDGRAAGAFDAETLGADGDAPIGADFGLGALAPDGGPPGAVWGGAQDGALSLESQIPGGLRGGAQLAVAFLSVVVPAEFFEQDIGLGQGGDVLCGEEWREAFLPEVVGTLDLAFGLRCGRVAQGDFVEAQGLAELGEGVGGAGQEKGVVVDVAGERETVGAAGCGQEVEMGVEIFAFVEACTGDHAAVVVDDFQEGGLAVLAVEPAVRRSVVWPKLADRLDLPAAHRAGLLFFLRCGAVRGPSGAMPSGKAHRRTVARSMAKSWRRRASEAARLQEQGGAAVRSLRSVSATDCGSAARWLPPEEAGLQDAARRIEPAARYEA